MIWTLYLALLALFFVGLSIRTLRLRRRLRIAIGDADNPAMLRAMRVHGNFAEYVPLGILLIGAVEQSGAPGLFVHVVGLCLLFGRLAHAFGVSREQEKFVFRVTGMSLTFLCYVIAAAYLLWMTFPSHS